MCTFKLFATLNLFFYFLASNLISNFLYDSHQGKLHSFVITEKHFWFLKI